MKSKKQDGKGQDVPTHQTKTEPERAYEKLIQRAMLREIAKFKKKVDK